MGIELALQGQKSETISLKSLLPLLYVVQLIVMIIMNDDNEGKLSICGVYTKRITAKKDNNEKNNEPKQQQNK